MNWEREKLQRRFNRIIRLLKIIVTQKNILGLNSDIFFGNRGRLRKLYN